MTKKAKRQYRLLHCVLIADSVFLALILLILAAFDQGLVTRTYRVKSDRLTNEEPIRIVLITDLHNYTFETDQQPLIERIARLEPDVICFSGDIVDDDSYPDRGTRLLLEGIKDLAPCYYVTGNHEHWIDAQAAKALMESYGVVVLSGESTILAVGGQTIRISGLEDPNYSRKEEYDQYLQPFINLPQDVFNILLCHRPDPIETISQYGFDLVLAGHAHGGQVRVPLLINGFFAPDQGWFPPYAGGLYHVNGTDMVVSRGLQILDQLPRIFNPPEVVAIDLLSNSR